jgi:DNA polymerase III sliding clamp (beta) subunit (PCNA family)
VSNGGDPKPFVIAFNVAYLLDALSAMRVTNVAVELTDPSRPGLFMPAGESGEQSYKYVLMPLHIRE